MAEKTRTLDQNAKMWAMLGDVARQVKWSVNGSIGYLDEADWKDIFTAGLTKHQRVAQGIEGGWVMLGQRTSKMRKSQMAELIEFIYSFGAEHNVTWTNDELLREHEESHCKGYDHFGSSVLRDYWESWKKERK